MRLSPYIFYPGTAEEALHFYADVFGGTISDVKRYEDSPVEDMAKDKRKLMHGRVSFGKSLLMLCDGPEVTTAISNIQLSVEFSDINDMNAKFVNLAESGKITMELQDAFWGARFGMLTDKFGINWMFNCELKKDKEQEDKNLDITV